MSQPTQDRSDALQYSLQTESTGHSQSFSSRNQQRTQSFFGSNPKYDPQASLKGSLYLNPQLNLLLPQVNFVGEDKFKRSSECFVCRSPFGSIKDRQHHCRYCGESCCSLCSTRTINSQRVCDICFLKATQITYEKKRRRFIKALKDHIEKMAASTKAGRAKIEELEGEDANQSMNRETEELKQGYNDLVYTLSSQETEKRRLQAELKRLTELYEPKVALKEKLKVQEAEIDQRLRQIDTDIYLKQQKHDEKYQQLVRLQKHLNDLEESESFLTLSHYQEAVKHDPVHVSQALLQIQNQHQGFKATYNKYEVQQQETQSQKTSFNRASNLYDSKFLDNNQILDLLNNGGPKSNDTTINKRQVTTVDKDERQVCKECRIF